MAPRVQPPPFNVALFDPDGKMNLAWQEWFLQATNEIADGSAPADAQYWVSTSEALLTHERNLGALASGYLKIAVALGIATPSSTSTIPTTDLSGTLAAAQEPAHTGDVTNAAGSLVLAIGVNKVTAAMLAQIAQNEVLGRTAAGTGNVSAIATSTLANLTGANVNHGTVTIDDTDSPYDVPAGVEVVLVDATGGAVTVNLPGPTSGRITTVKKIDVSINAVTVDGGGNDIDGAGTVSLLLQWNSVMVDSDGVDFFVLAQV